MLKRTTPKFWLPTLTVAWGVGEEFNATTASQEPNRLPVATLTGIVSSLPGFFVARLILGVTESGLFPGVVWYLSSTSRGSRIRRPRRASH